MYPSEIEKLVNAYKTNIPTQIFNDLKKDIVEDVLNEEPLQRLEDKLNEVIGPQLEVDKYYKEIKGALKTDILNRVTGFTYNMDHRLKEPVNSMITNTITNVFNNDDVIGGVIGDLDHLKNRAITTIQSEVNGVVGSNVRKFTGSVINKVTDAIYNINDPTGTTQLVGNFLNNTINDIGNGLTNGVNNLITGGSFDLNLANNIGSNLQSTFNSIKGNLVNQANGFLQKGLNSISDKVGMDISSIFSTPTIGLDSAGNLGLNGGFGIKDGAINNIIDKVTDKLGLGSGIGSMAKDILGNIGKSKVPSSIGSKESIKNKTQQSTKNQRVDSAQKGAQKKQQGKAMDKSTKSPKNRNDKDKKQQPKDNDEPQEEQYNNDIPPRAKVKNDPRRDGCQELVLWEGKSEKYVLLRDGKGNYIELNETKNNIRIQHTTGSFLEFRSNGDIVMTSAKKIYFNCAGPRKVNRY